HDHLQYDVEHQPHLHVFLLGKFPLRGRSARPVCLSTCSPETLHATSLPRLRCYHGLHALHRNRNPVARTHVPHREHHNRVAWSHGHTNRNGACEASPLHERKVEYPGHYGCLFSCHSFWTREYQDHLGVTSPREVSRHGRPVRTEQYSTRGFGG